ncbi:MAG: hypothetical protein ABIP53_00140 [Candidatus Limnocylindrales bacterium]
MAINRAQRRTTLTRRAIALALMLPWTVAACSAAPPATPSANPTAQATPAPTELPTASPGASPSPAPSHPTPTIPAPSATPAVSAIDGAYLTSFSKAELASSALLIDQDEISDGNWGVWTLTLDKGLVEYRQGNEVESSDSSGTFAVDGDAVTMAFTRGANEGETFGFRWRIDGATLTFERDESLGPGPTRFLVKPWNKTGTATAIPFTCCGATLFPSRYASSVLPGVTLTIGHEADLDCVAGYICRGDVNADFPFWLDLEFGNRHGSELMVFSFDKVLDPDSPGELMDLPADFAGWIGEQPQVTIVEAPHAVVIGGIAAQELDVTGAGDKGLDLYPTGLDDPPALGIGFPGQMVRLDVLRIRDRELIIQRMSGPEHTIGTFETAVEGLQAVVDSITFGTAAPTGQIVFDDYKVSAIGTQIWIENADGTGVRQLVDDDATDWTPSLSPDGKRVAFYSLADPTKAGVIMLVNADGTGLTELGAGGAALGCDDDPEGDAWSPDGERIAFARYCFDAAGTFKRSGIWTINVDGTDAREVTRRTPADTYEDHRATWSPDGERLAFVRIDLSVSPEKSAIFTVRTDGTDLQQVTPWELDANDPDWSPDGALIAFNSPAECCDDQNIYVVAPDGSALRQLTSGLSTFDDGGQGTYHPSWSPDGAQILFSHSPATDGFADLFVINRDGSDMHVLADSHIHENHADW